MIDFTLNALAVLVISGICLIAIGWGFAVVDYFLRESRR